MDGAEYGIGISAYFLGVISRWLVLRNSLV